jgi:hypothetical protein
MGLVYLFWGTALVLALGNWLEKGDRLNLENKPE